MRGERAPKKRDFLIETFQKVPKNAFCGLFFKNLPAAGQIWVFVVVSESSQNQFGRPKKKVDNIFKKMLTIPPPPREIPRSPPGTDILNDYDNQRNKLKIIEKRSDTYWLYFEKLKRFKIYLIVYSAAGIKVQFEELGQTSFNR